MANEENTSVGVASIDKKWEGGNGQNQKRVETRVTTQKEVSGGQWWEDAFLFPYKEIYRRPSLTSLSLFTLYLATP